MMSRNKNRQTKEKNPEKVFEENLTDGELASARANAGLRLYKQTKKQKNRQKTEKKQRRKVQKKLARKTSLTES